jgi:carbon monoxide dehydrogenase subunit G
MPGLSVSRSVSAPVDAVWTVFTDLARSADRLSAVNAVEVLTPGEFALGTRWRETRTMFGREATEEMEVTAIVPGRSYTTGADSHGSHYMSRFDFVPTETGTDVTFTFHAESHGVMRFVGSLMWPMLKGKMTKELRRDLDELAEYCERA